MSDHAELDLDSGIDLNDPWTVWGLEMGRLMRAAGIPPDEELLQSVVRLAQLRQDVEAKEAALPGARTPSALVGQAASGPE
jgi:hypothetical protein